MGKSGDFCPCFAGFPWDLEVWIFAMSQSNDVRRTWHSHEIIDQQGAPQSKRENAYFGHALLGSHGTWRSGFLPCHSSMGLERRGRVMET